MVLLYGRAGRFTAKNGGFWPGQLVGAAHPSRADEKAIVIGQVSKTPS
jgi:hypothetical protein